MYDKFNKFPDTFAIFVRKLSEVPAAPLTFLVEKCTFSNMNLYEKLKKVFNFERSVLIF